MTRQEAIEILKEQKYFLTKNVYKSTNETDREWKFTKALNMAIEALTKEPNPLCALADRECPFQGKEFAWCLTCPHISEEDRALVKKVASEPKRGKWIDRVTDIDARFGRHDFVCSECARFADYFIGGSEDWWGTEKPNYCPNCGADMRGDEE